MALKVVDFFLFDKIKNFNLTHAVSDGNLILIAE
jgi:hypothetical protein